MVMFFPKKASSYLTFLPKLLPLSLSIFLDSFPNCSATCSCYSMKNAVRYIRTGVKPPFAHLNPNTTIVLYYGQRRKKTCQCQGSGMEGGSTTTCGASYRQGKGLREARNDARVLNSGPAQAQLIRGVLQHLTIGGCYLLFTLVLGIHARCIFHHSLRQSRCWHEPKILSLSQRFPSFPHSQLTCKVWIQPYQHSHMLQLV